MDPFDAPVGLGPSGRDAHVFAPELVHRPREPLLELAPAIGRDALQTPPASSQILRYPLGEAGGPPRRGVLVRHVQIGPQVGRGHIDRGVLPDGPLGV